MLRASFIGRPVSQAVVRFVAPPRSTNPARVEVQKQAGQVGGVVVQFGGAKLSMSPRKTSNTEHRTSNTEHPTPNAPNNSMFGVRCWKFDVSDGCRSQVRGSNACEKTKGGFP